MVKKSMLINPKRYDVQHADQKTHDVMKNTINFFEHKGLKAIREDDKLFKWQEDWIKYQGEKEIYATMLTCKGYGRSDSRFDLSRICELNEIFGFYGFAYQYPYQVSILGVGPVWMSNNEEQKQELAQQLLDGHVFAFGMSEKDHGADLYENGCTLKPTGNGSYVANGNKYYIGNGHIAPKVATLGKNTETGEWVYWVVNSQHRNYNYVKRIETPGLGQAVVAEYEMIEYPITDHDILTVGDKAFADGLSSVNIGKFQLGFCSTGIVTHALYEAITHANRRILYGKPVTNFPHIRSFLSESFCRANAMKLYALRSLDYFRSMSDSDRRYLLFNPIQKMKVCTQAAVIMQNIMDVVCAKGYERDTYISDADTTVHYLYRLEGTAHVNMALVLKFMQNYFFGQGEYPEIPVRNDPQDDTNVFYQSIGGLGKVKFPAYDKAYQGVTIPNVKIFRAQIEIFKNMLVSAAPDESLLKNMDFMLNIGEIFTMIVYAQLILESSKLHDVHDDLIDQIFSYFVKDVAKFAGVQMLSQANTKAQDSYFQQLATTKPVIDKEKDFKFWQEFVQVLDGAYVMNESTIGV